LTQLWPIFSWIAAALLLVLLHQVKAGFLGLGFTGAVVLGHVLYGLIALCVLLPAVFGEHEAGAVRRLLRVRALVWIGLISYAFYLYHTIVIAQLGRHLNGTSTAPRYAIVAVGSFLISLACAAASYYLFERPIMRWGRSARWRVGRPLRDGVASGHELP
jgi:peptidoglycan/LPS O-acetylase OafA/YrhL